MRCRRVRCWTVVGEALSGLTTSTDRTTPLGKGNTYNVQSESDHATSIDARTLEPCDLEVNTSPEATFAGKRHILLFCYLKHAFGIAVEGANSSRAPCTPIWFTQALIALCQIAGCFLPCLLADCAVVEANFAFGLNWGHHVSMLQSPRGLRMYSSIVFYGNADPW